MSASSCSKKSLHEIGRQVLLAGTFAGAFVATAGCDAGNEDVVSVSSALSTGWRSWSSNTPTNTNALSSPAVCPAHVRSKPGISGYILIGRDLTTNRYKLAMYGKLQPWREWSDISDATVTFDSKPVCASLDGLNLGAAAMWTEQIAVVGRRPTDSKLYIQLMKVQGNDDLTIAPPVPTVTMPWASIGNGTYSSAPFVLVHESAYIVVGGRRADNRFYLHYNRFQWNEATRKWDYKHSKWEAAIQLPALPAGWIPTGDPTIGNIGNYSGEVKILTRAQKNGQTKVFSLWMFLPVKNTVGTQWEEFATGTVAPASDLAMEYEKRLSPNPAATVYYRGTDGRVYNSTGDGWTWAPFTVVDNTSDPNDNYTDFIGSPGVLGSSEMEGGHIVAMRRNSPTTKYFTASPVPTAGY